MGIVRPFFWCPREAALAVCRAYLSRCATSMERSGTVLSHTGIHQLLTLLSQTPMLLSMTLPRWVAAFNRRATNRLTLPLAPHLPTFGVVVHTGRTTGRHFRTPVNVFARPDGFVVALTYGPDAQWVRNVLAAGGCTLETRGRRWRLTGPRLVHDERLQAVPPPVRVVLGLLHADDFLDLSLER